MIVVDASVVIEVVLARPDAVWIGNRILAIDESLHAPHLLYLEVLHALRRYCQIGQLELPRASQAIAYLADFPLTRHPHRLYLSRIWELRNNMTAYDASYIALAEALDAPFLTRDKRLASAPGHRAEIELI